MKVTYFTAKWCAPCKQLLPKAHGFVASLIDVEWKQVDIDESPGLAKQFGVMSVPTIAVTDKGKVTAILHPATMTWPIARKQLSEALNVAPPAAVTRTRLCETCFIAMPQADLNRQCEECRAS